MGIFDKRREQLGINAPKAAEEPRTPQKSSGGASAFERRRQELAGKREADRQASIAEANKKTMDENAMRAGSAKARADAEADQSRIDQQKQIYGSSLARADAEEDQRMRDPVYRKKKEEEAAQNYIKAGQERRDSQDPKNKTLDFIKDNTVDALAGAIERWQVNTDRGRFANRLSNKAGELQGINTQAAGAAPVLSTGNRVLDKTADIAGYATGLLVDPSMPAQAAASVTGIGTQLRGMVNKASGGVKNVVPSTEKPKQSLYTKLFGNEVVGAIAGKKAPRRSGTGMQIVDNPLKKDAQTKFDEVKEFGRSVKQDYVDLTAPLKHLGGDVQDVALDARRSNNLANTWIHDKAVTPEGEVIGVSLKDVIGSVPRGEADAFEDYLIVRHAKTRVARGEKVYEDRLGMNDVPKLTARQAELEKRFPHFAKLGEQWDEYNTRLLDTGESFGLISKAQKEAMRTENPNYASMRRQFSTSEKFSQPFAMKTNSFSGQKAPIKAVSPTGSARKIVSPVRSAIEQTGAWMNAGMRNRVMQSLLQRVQADPDGMKGIVELLPETSARAKDESLAAINDVLAREGVEGLTEMLDQEFSVLFKTTKQRAGDKTDNVVTVMVDGTPVKMRVMNPEIFKSLVGMGPQESNFVLDFFGMLSNATKRGATGALAPLFAAKSVTVDLAQAIIQSKNPLQHVPDVLHATVSAIANQLPRNAPGVEKIRSLAQEFERVGGEYSAALRGDKPLKKAVGALRKEPLLSPRGIGKGALATVKAPFRFLEGVSDVAENINRIAAYKGAMRRAGGVRTPETVRGAMRESQEITTNFSRKGAKSETIEKFIPYSNAAIQGMRRFAVQLRDNPGKTALMVGGFVIAPKLWEQARFGDDEDYQKLPARTRYRNIIVGKKADGTFIQVPMPPEYTALGAMAADVMAEIRGQDYVRWRDVSDALVNAYTPPFVSGALQGVTQANGPKSALEQSGWGLANSSSAGPIVGTLANQQWNGAPIVSQTYAANSPYMQKDERTSKISEWLASNPVGKALGLSPMKTDYLIKQYGGDLARLGLPLTSDVGGGTTANTLLRAFIVDPTFTNNLSRDYYNRVDRVKAVTADIGDGAKAPAWYTDTVKKLATGRAKGDPGKMISDLNATKRSIQGDRSLSAEKKSQKLREVQEQINAIYLDVSAKLDSMGVPR